MSSDFEDSDPVFSNYDIDIGTPYKFSKKQNEKDLKLSLPVQLPDLRFEESYLKALHKYANKSKGTNINDKDKDDLPITLSTILIVTFKSQILMPFLQGFFMAGALMLLRPWIKTAFKTPKTRKSSNGNGNGFLKHLFDNIGTQLKGGNGNLNLISSKKYT